MDLRDPSVSHIDNSSNKHCNTKVFWDQNQERRRNIVEEKDHCESSAMGENHKAGKLNFLPDDVTMLRLSLVEPIPRMIPLKLTLMLDLGRTTKPYYAG